MVDKWLQPLRVAAQEIPGISPAGLVKKNLSLNLGIFMETWHWH